MKRLLLAVIVIFCTGTGFQLYAQDEIAEIQKEWGKDKRELVRLGMALAARDSVKFWPMYDKYEKERQKLGRERIVIIEDYANHYEGITNAKADELINKIFKNEAAVLKLQQQYYNNFKTTLNAMQAAKFLQIETYINGVLRVLLQSEIPVIGELDDLKKTM